MATRKTPITREEVLEEGRLARRALDAAINRADEAQRAIAQLAVQAEPEDGAVIRFVRTLPTTRTGYQDYNYAAIRAGGLWYLTGQRITGMSWTALISFIRAGKNAVAVEVLTHDRFIDLT